MRAVGIAMLALTGCSQILGFEDFHAVDAAVDTAPVDAPTALVSGRVSENSLSFVEGATISFVRLSDHATLSSTMSNSIGQYSLEVPTNTDGYLFVERNTDENTLQYLSAPITGDRSLTAFVFTPAYIDSLAAHVSINQSASGGFMLLQIRDAMSNGLAGVTVQASAGALYYVGPNGPDAAQTMTDSGGLVVVFNVPAQTVTLTATLGSTTTPPRMVTVVGASVTLVPIIVM